MEFEYPLPPPDSYIEYSFVYGEYSVTFIFLATILAVFLISSIIAMIIFLIKPQLFRLNVYPDPEAPGMTDCSCLNVCFPCTSCSFRRNLNLCCPRMNLKQRFNCITTFCNRPGPERVNLVCCVV